MKCQDDKLSAYNNESNCEKFAIELLERLGLISRNFSHLARKIPHEQRFDDCFLDTLDNPPVKRTFGNATSHVITHNMHHRTQVMYLMKKVGLKDHIDGDLLSWESSIFGVC